MTGLTHCIKRQTLELHIDDPARAGELQDQLSRLNRQHIVPLLDRYCSELSDARSIHRIDRLELDLGRIDLENLEQELVGKLQQQLRPELAEQITRQSQSKEENATHSQLELFECFARSGNLPWWVDKGRPDLLKENLTQLLRDAPRQLHRLMVELIPERATLQRLIRHYDDDGLTRLLSLLTTTPWIIQLPEALTLLSAEAGSSIPGDRQHQRDAIRLITLEITGESGHASAPLLKTALTRLAHELDSHYSELLPKLSCAALSHKNLIHPELYQGILKLAQELKPAAPVDQQLQSILRQSEQIPGPLVQLWRALQNTQADLPAGTRQQLLKILQKLVESAEYKTLQSTLHNLPIPAREVLLKSLRQSGQITPQTLLGDLPPATQEQLRELLRQPPDTARHPALSRPLIELLDSAPVARALPPALLKESLALCRLQDLLEQAGKARQPGNHTTVDSELYLDNAGLVILWPFLTRFFQRLGLLEEQHFIDNAAPQRAVRLLQYLVTETPDPAEYLLPLNKILCGIPPDGLYQPDQPLSEQEIEECNQLLPAVIHNAPVLKEMSVEGFRGSFLLRRGILSSRDGAWLLQIERESYDIVLDRFPWSTDWVKLPWMETALRVEW